jgi:alkylresorcinol/alkylpyrone synthase
MLAALTADLLARAGLTRADVHHWILHSAGYRVLERAQQALGLPDDALAASRAVLRRLGNMSSATVLFVLEETLRARSPEPGDWGVMAALGPGFAAEGVLLRW